MPILYKGAPKMASQPVKCLQMSLNVSKCHFREKISLSLMKCSPQKCFNICQYKNQPFT